MKFKYQFGESKSLSNVHECEAIFVLHPDCVRTNIFNLPEILVMKNPQIKIAAT